MANETYIPNEMLVKFLEYLEQHILIALDGKTNGHNFNSYMPKEIKEAIPNKFHDIVYCALSDIAKYQKTKQKYGGGFKRDEDFKFLNLTGYEWKYNCGIPYGGWDNGIGLLQLALKTIELYLNK